MKSMINEAKVTKRFNLGDYQHEEYTLGAIVDEKDSGAEVLAELKKQILEAYSGEVSSEEEQPKKKEEKKNGKPKASPVASEDDSDEDVSEEDAGDDGESSENDEAADGEADDNNDSDAEDSDSDSDESDDAEKPKASQKGSKKDGKKKFRTKAQTYNRSIEQHKEIFSGVLRSVSPDWKKSDKTKALAKKASTELEGENFLDENGEVVESFKSQVAKIMKGKSK